MMDTLSEFFDTSEFASTFERWNGIDTSPPFAGIFSVADEEALDGYAISAQYVLHYPTSAIALKQGDELVTTDASIAGRYKVRAAPMRVNDGQESRVFLSKSGAD